MDYNQVIHVSGEAYDPLCLIYGVTTGSVLGLLEFTAYICPIYDIAPKAWHQHTPRQYVDDGVCATILGI